MNKNINKKINLKENQKEGSKENQTENKIKNKIGNKNENKIKNEIENKNGEMSDILSKLLSREVILYIVFGVVTTLVNWVSFYILNKFFNMNDNVANIIAITLSVLVAYFTNRTLVFNSQAKGIKEKSVEFAKFMGGRAFTMILEFGIDSLLFLTPIPQMVTKVVVTIIVVILNYFISKFFAFKNK